MSTARFAFLCTAVVVLIFVASTVGIGIVVLGVLAGLFAILQDHRKLYFQTQRRDPFTYAAYLFALILMIWTTVAVGLKVPRMLGGTLILWEGSLPNPFPTGYWLHFALGSLFLMWALKPANLHVRPMTFTGAVVWDQWGLLRQTPRVILESLKRSARTLVHEHWLKGLAGLVLLVLSVPIGLVALMTGAAAVLWFAVFWAGLSMLIVIPLWLVFRLLHRKGFSTACPGCGKTHHHSGPGPLGLFHLRCECGQKIALWRRDSMEGSTPETPAPLPWRERPRQPGTLPLLVIGVVTSLLMVWKAFRF